MTYNYRKICFRCLRSEKSCLCSRITAFRTKTKFIILMHPKEAKKQKVGTGRVSSLLLSNSEIIVGINFIENRQVNSYLESDNYQCFVLYPGELALNLSNKESSLHNLKTNKENIIFVIDGTWPCAKKMMKLSTNINSLPRICFTPSEQSRFAIKHQPDKYCLSTIEALYFTIDSLIQRDLELKDLPHQQMMDILDHIVKYQKDKASDPTIPGYRKVPYKDQNERSIAIRWKKRKIYFD